MSIWIKRLRPIEKEAKPCTMGIASYGDYGVVVALQFVALPARVRIPLVTPFLV